MYILNMLCPIFSFFCFISSCVSIAHLHMRAARYLPQVQIIEMLARGKDPSWRATVKPQRTKLEKRAKIEMHFLTSCWLITKVKTM